MHEQMDDVKQNYRKRKKEPKRKASDQNHRTEI